MNSLRLLVVLAVWVFVTCKPNAPEPEPPQPEQTLFENITPCCKLYGCDCTTPIVCVKLLSD
jgi:hypothetical protein